MRHSFDPAECLERIARGEIACRDLEMRIDRQGVWHHAGRPIGRPELVRLFARILHQAADGTYWLVTPAEQGRILVEDVPFLAVELAVTVEQGEQRLKLRTNVDEWILLSAARPLRSGHGPQGTVPYLLVRPGIEARLVQSVYYELAELAVPDAHDPSRLGVWSAGTFFALGRDDAVE
jgi:uncharacterized protein